MAYARAAARKKLMTEAMSMEDLWPRQSVHGWVLFLGIKSVYNDYKQQKWNKITEASASVGLLLATAVYAVDSFALCLSILH